MKQNTTNKKAYKEKDERNLKMDKIIQFVIKGAILTPEQVEKMIDNKIKLIEYHYHNKELK